MPVLKVLDLEVSFGSTRILQGVSFELEAGKTLGIVGESGCGKSMTAFAIMKMLHSPGRISKGQILFEGMDLVTLSEAKMRQIRGKDIALVMQDPFTSLNPMMRVGDQIAESLVLHQDKSWAEARTLAVELMDKVGVPSPESSAKKFPHQLSGGQRQRIVIATAFACKPKVLLADEPTTALDVTLQAQILRLIRALQEEEDTAVMLISHDIGAIASVSDSIAVFYAGQIVEMGSAAEVLHAPTMPYTKALLNALPSPGKERLEAIDGQPPMFTNLPPGCSFAPRCQFADERCEQARPNLVQLGPTRQTACFKAEEMLNARR